MDEFGYLSVIISVILGLSIAQLLQGLSQIINARDRVQIYWPTIAWAILLLIVDIQAWWAMFGYRTKHDWTFLQFAVVLLETVFLYLLAALVMPSISERDAVDLKANYFRHAGWFFGSLAAVLIDSLLKDVVVRGALPHGLNLGFHVFWIMTACIAAPYPERAIPQNICLRQLRSFCRLYCAPLRRAKIAPSATGLRQG